MGIVLTLSAAALRPVVGWVCRCIGVDPQRGKDATGRVVSFLSNYFADHSQLLPAALRRANEQAWKALEVSLAGDSFWDRCKVALAPGDYQGFRAQMQKFLEAVPLAGNNAEFRQECLLELRAAKKAGLFASSQYDPQQLAERVGAFARFADPHGLLEAEWVAIEGMAGDLDHAGYPRLARLLATRPPEGPPVLAAAVRYFFRREVETNRDLFQGLTADALDALHEGQAQGFAALAEALTICGERLEELLDDMRDVALQTQASVLNMRQELQQLSQQQDHRDAKLELFCETVLKLKERHRLAPTEVRQEDSLSISDEGERQEVRDVVAVFRGLPAAQQRRLPALLNSLAQLEMATGDFGSAQRDFQQVATGVANAEARAEAYHNVYRAALERKEWSEALEALRNATSVNPRRFAPFPLDKYEPERILGAGAFGVAFLCRHRYLNEQVVVKTLATARLDRDVARVFGEARILRSLDHSGIVRLRDCGYADTDSSRRPFLEMEFFDGPTLAEHVERNGPLQPKDLLSVARDLAEALLAAHSQGVLHRDIKPANILLRNDISGWVVKLIDFGLALRPAAVETTLNSRDIQGRSASVRSVVGTLDYAAPEQLGRLQGVAVGPAADVYGFGRTCLYALFGTVRVFRRHWRSVDEGIADLVEHCLAELPPERPGGFAVILEALEGVEARLRVSSAPVKVTAPSGMDPRLGKVRRTPPIRQNSLSQEQLAATASGVVCTGTTGTHDDTDELKLYPWESVNTVTPITARLHTASVGRKEVQECLAALTKEAKKSITRFTDVWLPLLPVQGVLLTDWDDEEFGRTFAVSRKMFADARILFQELYEENPDVFHSNPALGLEKRQQISLDNRLCTLRTQWEGWRVLARSVLDLYRRKPCEVIRENALRAILGNVPEEDEMLKLFQNEGGYALSWLRSLLASGDVGAVVDLGITRIYQYGNSDQKFEEKVSEALHGDGRIVNVRWWDQSGVIELIASLMEGQSLQVRARTGAWLPLRVGKGGRIEPRTLKAVSAACGEVLTEETFRQSPLAFCYDFHGINPIAVLPDLSSLIEDSKSTSQIIQDQAQADQEVNRTPRLMKVQRFRIADGFMHSVVYCPDGLHALIARSGHPITMWGLESGKQVLSFGDSSRGACHLLLSGDGLRVLSNGGDEFGVQLWELQTGKELQRLPKGYFLGGAGRSASGRLGLIWVPEKTPPEWVLWDFERWDEISHFRPANSDDGQVYALSPDGRHAILVRENRATLYDVQSGDALSRVAIRDANPIWYGDEEIKRVLFSSDGNYVFLGCGRGEFSGSVRRWDLRATSGLQDLTSSYSAEVSALDLSPNGRHLLVGTEDGVIALYDLEKEIELSRFQFDADTRLNSLAFSPDGFLAASTSSDNFVRVYRLPLPNPVKPPAIPSLNHLPSLEGYQAAAAKCFRTTRQIIGQESGFYDRFQAFSSCHAEINERCYFLLDLARQNGKVMLPQSAVPTHLNRELLKEEEGPESMRSIIAQLDSVLVQVFHEYQRLLSSVARAYDDESAPCIPAPVLSALLGRGPELPGMLRPLRSGTKDLFDQLRNLLEQNIALEVIVNTTVTYCYGSLALSTFERCIVEPCSQRATIVSLRMWRLSDAIALITSLKEGQTVRVRTCSGERLTLAVVEGGRVEASSLAALGAANGVSLTETAFRRDPLAYCYDFHGLTM